MLDVPILKYLAQLSQSYAMANMYLIVRAWCLDRDYYSPNTGRGYARKRESLSANNNRFLDVLLRGGVRKIPLGKFPQRMFYSVLFLIFFLKYNIVDFPGYDDIVGNCYVPAYGLFLYGLCVVFLENDVNHEEKSVYGWAILSLVVGVVLWSDILHLGGAVAFAELQASECAPRLVEERPPLPRVGPSLKCNEARWHTFTLATTKEEP